MTILAGPTAPAGAFAARPVRAGRAVARVPTEDLLRAYRLMAPGRPERGRLRTRAIEDNLPLATRMARRFTMRGERLEDLAQVAALALVQAVDSFDPDRGTSFTNYAIPTVLGALKRYFRDTTWTIRPPRPVQQLLLDLPAATADLAQRHGRSPTPAELAAYLHVTVEDLATAHQAAQMYRLPSLNAAVSGEDGGGELGDTIGGPDPAYERVEQRLSYRSPRPFVAALPLRERRIVVLRFYHGMTQDRIAAELGISQVHVSRLLRRALADLRAAYLTTDAAAEAVVPVRHGATRSPGPAWHAARG